MRSLSGWSLTSSALVALGISATTATPIMISAPVLAQVTTPTPAPAPATTAPSFADVPADYWALPFIQALAARNVIVGYPDGTYKPDQPVPALNLLLCSRKLLH